MKERRTGNVSAAIERKADQFIKLIENITLLPAP